MVDVNWNWPAIGLGFTADGSIMRKLFAGSNLSDAGLLARESLQNSTDAASRFELEHPGVPFRVQFRFVKLIGEEKRRAVIAMRLDQLAKQAKRYRKEDSPILEGSILQEPKALADLKTPLRLLYVEDFGTHGLYGHPNKFDASHFYKAMYALGAMNKWDGAGGSFGFGKSAIARASSTSTMFGYSAFDTYAGDNVQSRLIGFTWWSNLHDGVTPISGVGSFAKLRESGNSTEPHPFEDGEATELANTLGFTVRNPKKTEDWGSSFMIVDHFLDAEELKSEIEKWWWPRLEDHALDVRIIKESGEEIVPEPSSNSFVAQFLKPYRIATGLDMPADPKRERLASSEWGKNGDMSSKELGTLGLCVVPEPINEKGESTKDTRSLTALIRGPRMVVTYQANNTKGTVLRGAFVASASANGHLRKVEPDQHNDWESTHKNKIGIPKEATQIAKAVKTQIKAAVDKMAAEAAPAPQNEKQALGHFAKLMGGFFGTSKGPTLPPKVGGERVEIHFVRKPSPEIVDNENVRTTAEFTVRLADKAKEPSLIVRVSCPVKVFEDEGHSSSQWGVNLEPTENMGDFEPSSDGSWLGRIDKLDWTTFRVSTDEYPNQWTVAVEPTVERLSEGA